MSLFLCVCCGILLPVLFCHPCTNREVQSSFLGVRRTGPRALLLLARQGKCCVVRIIHKSSIGVVLRDPDMSHRHRLVNPAENKSVSAHSEQCESVFLVHFEKCQSFVWSIRVLCEVRDVSSGFSAHSVRCERERVESSQTTENITNIKESAETGESTKKHKASETVLTSFFQDLCSIPAGHLDLAQAERTHWVELWKNVRVDCTGGTWNSTTN